MAHPWQIEPTSSPGFFKAKKKKEKTHSHREILNPDNTDLRPSAVRKIKNEQNSVEQSLNYTQK